MWPCRNGSRMSSSSIYPAVQNMLLAARALGLGATLTTLHVMFEKEADAAFGLPEGIQLYAILPMGYPMGNFRPGPPHGLVRGRFRQSMG